MMKSWLLVVALANILYVPTLAQDVTIRYVASSPLAGLYVSIDNSTDSLYLGDVETSWYLDDTGVGYKICNDSSFSWCLSGQPNSEVMLDNDPDYWTVWTWRNENSTNIIPIDWTGNYQSNFTAPYLDINSDSVSILNNGDYPYGWEITTSTNSK